MIEIFGLEMSIHGWIALLFGSIGVIVLNVGLIRLMHRRVDREPGPDRRDDWSGGAGNP